MKNKYLIMGMSVLILICLNVLYVEKQSFKKSYNSEIKNTENMTTIEVVEEINNTLKNEIAIENVIEEINDEIVENSEIEINDNYSEYEKSVTKVNESNNIIISNSENVKPKFGEKYATMIIDKIGVNAPIFFGANENIILYGIGHEEESYLPGEGGSIILCGHNYMNNFSRFDELTNGDIIKIKTDYGEFDYQLYDSQIVFETERDKAPIQNNEEILMIYTCYPLKNTEYTQYRYLLYARRCN